MIGLGISMEGMGCGSDIYLVYHDVPILNFAGKVSILACVLNLWKARLDSAQLGLVYPNRDLLTVSLHAHV